MGEEPVLGSGERRVVLPDGRTLVIRPSGDADVAGIEHLYDSLSDDDRYRRFFSVYHPGPSFFTRLVHIVERGGLDLVAVVEPTDGTPAFVVAEAGYFPMPNGDAELAVTVDRARRGWLGAYLLDVLVAEARQRGIPNLEAEILLENRPMLALVRNRAHVVLCREDPATIRVAIGAAAAR
jgi:hypothetical protein